VVQCEVDGVVFGLGASLGFSDAGGGVTVLFEEPRNLGVVETGRGVVKASRGPGVVVGDDFLGACCREGTIMKNGTEQLVEALLRQRTVLRMTVYRLETLRYFVTRGDIRFFEAAIEEAQQSLHALEAAELDEMWSCVGKKQEPRWLWHAIDHCTGKVLASVFGRRKDEVFLQLKALLEPFGLTRYYTDHWGAYTRHLDPEVHSPGKRNTQKIERRHLTLRTRIKRVVRKTICFSKTTQMHDIVIGLFVNRYAFGRAV